MKVKIAPTEGSFSPIDVTITLQTKREALLFLSIINDPGQLATIANRYIKGEGEEKFASNSQEIQQLTDYEKVYQPIDNKI